MSISDERKQELEELCVLAYRQISAGYAVDKIRDQFVRLDLEPYEIDWIMTDGRERYLGFKQFQRDNNRGFAKNLIFGGLGTTTLAVLFVLIMGWSSAGRQNGLITFAMLGGIGAAIYGAYVWLTAEPTDTRTDV